MFTDSQLEAIKVATSKTKNQGELAVYKFIVNQPATKFGPPNGFTVEQLNVLRYIAEECKRQHSGERSVYQMALAWVFATTLPYTDSGSAVEILDTIGNVAALIEPTLNRNGYRRVAVGVMDKEKGWQEKAPWTSIERLMGLLSVSFVDGVLEAVHPKAQDAIDEFYYQFEMIHPYMDGNGRTGKVIYNWLKGTLNSPVLPPLFWEGSIP